MFTELKNSENESQPNDCRKIQNPIEVQKIQKTRLRARS